jgi:hypothetical protein
MGGSGLDILCSWPLGARRWLRNAIQQRGPYDVQRNSAWLVFCRNGPVIHRQDGQVEIARNMFCAQDVTKLFGSDDVLNRMSASCEKFNQKNEYFMPF